MHKSPFLCAAALLAAALVFAPGVASSQTPSVGQNDPSTAEGTLFTRALRQASGGELFGCGIEFATVARDFATRRGERVVLNGSFNIMKLDQHGIGYSLKLGVFPLVANAKPEAPALGYVRAPRSAPPPSSRRSPAEAPGYALFMGPGGKEVLAIIDALLGEGIVEIGFNRKAGQIDVTAVLDLAVEDIRGANGAAERIRSRKTQSELSECIGQLVR